MIGSLTPDVLITRIIVLVIAFTVHEFSHAFVADRFGDDTPRRQGRLTLNPLVHLDPLGSLLLLVAGFGWARPVQINPLALERRSPAAPMLVALAGPASNFLLAIVGALPLRFGLVLLSTPVAGWYPTADQFLSDFVLINLVLMIFNLIPVFPLDGEKILHFFLPPSGKAVLENTRAYGSLILLGLIFLLPSMGVNLIQDIVLGPAIAIGRFLVLGG
ncbi:MAG: site-2 protease family protein [Anaerolineales bacterium]